ncbi:MULTISPECIES: methionine--tRNA ligase [unclassified Kitasatospora]|uniref:methionine--tRNA ligase n=1 Tax=unclassified Kitasatospora TaxID=2633591 RepID=UPI00070F2798|nr:MULTISPECIES: methionine--tRNA ligase [unclassified Kitasatospora]KQV24006.1 methionine--tRNA ligase [Kitasatospora sp. Root107]KRB67280.1 methionine--tRNA ligase [Kitasatospora sp. Root187]
MAATADHSTTEASNSAYYVSTPIYYVNDRPHLGHAYTTVAGDVLTRWHRQRGEKVWYLTGTDEHGQKIMRTADTHGVTPQQWCDKLVEEEWKPLWQHLNVANDDFIRTTQQRHTDRVQEFVQGLFDKGEIYKGGYEGPYCVGCEEYKIPGELLPGATADEKLCPVHKKPVEWLEEENYFFRLSAYGPKLLEFYAQNPDFIAPASARNEVLRFVEQDLKDLSISRSTFNWGIPLPWDEKHVLYVWVDALLNYITAAGYGADPERFAELWPASVHLVGKDILRFHAVIWPAMLMAAGLPLPKRVVANGWLMVGGEKMSKSNLTGISPQQLTSHFGVDAYRYYFLRAIPFGTDGSFSWEDFSARYTSELANDFGNLASRVAAMVGKYYEGSLPAATASGVAEQAIADGLVTAAQVADRKIGEELDFAGGIAAVFEFIKQVNGYLTEQEPWKVAKDESAEGQARLATILYTAAEALRATAVLLNPLMPATAEKLWESLGAEPELGPLAAQTIATVADWGRLPVGATVTKGEILFPRLEEKPAA